MNTKLLACKAISDQARAELKRADCAVHKEVPGLDDDIEIVELRHNGEKDLNVMSVRDVPREIQIASRNLYLLYTYNELLSGYELTMLHEDSIQQKFVEVDDVSLDDLEDYRF